MHDGDASDRDPTAQPLSRRRFLKQAGGVALAASVAPWVVSSTPAPKQSLGIALVGLGNYATGQLAPALQETAHCHLAGIVTGSPEKIPVWQRRHDIPDANVYDYKTFDHIADNDAIDIVYVVLPNGLHAEYTIRAAEAGKHVICEKPMANSVEECEAMIEACEQANRSLSIGYRLHFEPHNQRAMELGQEEVFGPVERIEAGFAFHLGHPSEPHVAWRLDKEMAGGGALVDIGIYTIQAGRYVTGEEPLAVATATESKTEPEKFHEVDETVHFELAFPGGVRAVCDTSYTDQYDRLHAEAEDGWFTVQPAFNYSHQTGRTSEGPMSLPAVNQQARQMDGIARSIQQGEPSRVPGKEGLRDVRIIEAIYEAIETGERVDIE